MNPHPIYPKLEALLQSPKFWAATVPLATALALYQLGELDLKNRL